MDNNNFNNLPDSQKANLLKMAGQKLGKDPAELKKELEAGNINNVLAGLDQNTANQVNTLLKNPAALQAMLGNDKVKNMLNGLLGGKK